MIKFSERQLKTPKLMRPVYLVTAGQSKFDRAIPEKRTEELCVDALAMAARLIDKSPAELKSYIHSCYYGHFADHFGDQLLGEAVIHDRLGLDPLGNIGIKTGGATGGSTLWETVKAVASGYSDCALAMGWERMDEVPTDEGNHLISCAADKDWETPLGHIYTGYYAVMAQKYWQVFGKEEESFRRTLAEISVKHHGYARFNPYAQAPMDITVDDVLNSPVVAYPLRALDCCLMSVGAACAIICDEATAVELTKNTQHKPLRIWVAAGSHTLRPACRRDMEIPLLPNESADQYADIEEKFPGGGRYPGFTGFLGARMCAYYGYRMAGIVDPMEDLDVVELHDAFTISDVQSYEDLGIRPYGYGRDYVESGDCYHTNPHTGQPGKLPSNLSGGLIGCMHAVGATGIMQTLEVASHIWNRWAEIHGDPKTWEEFGREKPADWTDLQVKDAKRALAVSHAGVGSHVTATVVMDPDHLLKEDAQREEKMSIFGTVRVKNGQYKIKGDFHHLTPNMPIRNEEDGWKLMGITNPRSMTYMHSYGGEAPFFESISQGKILGTRCDDPDCEFKGTTYIPFRIHCPDCLSKNTIVNFTDICKNTAKIHTFMVCERSGAFNTLDKPIKFINVEFEGIDTILMSYLSIGEPEMALRVVPIFRTRNPSYTITDLSWVTEGVAEEDLPEGFTYGQSHVLNFGFPR